MKFKAWLVTVLFAFISFNTFAEMCYAPNNISSACDKLKSPVEYKDFVENQNVLALDSKTGKVENYPHTLKGKLIRFIDQNKNYAIQIVDTNQAFTGTVLALQISSRTQQSSPNQSIESTRVKQFVFVNKKITITETESSSLYTQIDGVNFELKNLSESLDPKSPEAANSRGTDQSLEDGTQIITLNKPNLNFVDAHSGLTIKSIQSNGTTKTVQSTDISSLLGKVFANKVEEFKNRHTEALNHSKALNECRKNSVNCKSIEQEYAKADYERDQAFMNIVEVADVNLRPIPQPPSAPQRSNGSYNTYYDDYYYQGLYLGGNKVLIIPGYYYYPNGNLRCASGKGLRIGGMMQCAS